MPRYAPPHPWRAADRIDGLIPVRDARGHDVLFVPADNTLATERTIEVIEQWSDLTAHYLDIEDAGIRAAVRRISALDILIGAFTAGGVAAGVYAQVML